MNEKITWDLPIKTVSESNSSEHWTKKSTRHHKQQFFTRLSFNKNVKKVTFPCVVKLIRLSPRFLDAEENLPMAFKWIKDELGACMFPEKIVNYVSKSGKVIQNKGHADSDERVTWEFGQEKSKTQAIRIEITFSGT